MKYVPSPLIGRLSKSAGSITAAYNKFGSYLRNRVTPTNPNTSFQTSVRGNFATLSATWRSLSDAQREAWTTLGTSMERQDSLGQTYSLTGLQAFISLNNNLITAGQAAIGTAPAMGTPDAPTVLGATIDASAGTVSVLFNPPAAGEFLAVYATRPMSDGRQFASSSEFKLLTVLDDAGTSPVALGTEYVNRFGVITGKTGDRVFLRAKTINAVGQASTHKQISTVIVA